MRSCNQYLLLTPNLPHPLFFFLLPSSFFTTVFVGKVRLAGTRYIQKPRLVCHTICRFDSCLDKPLQLLPSLSPPEFPHTTFKHASNPSVFPSPNQCKRKETERARATDAVPRFQISTQKKEEENPKLYFCAQRFAHSHNRRLHHQHQSSSLSESKLPGISFSHISHLATLNPDGIIFLTRWYRGIGE